jgi:hypothetical protein
MNGVEKKVELVLSETEIIDNTLLQREYVPRYVVVLLSSILSIYKVLLSILIFLKFSNVSVILKIFTEPL